MNIEEISGIVREYIQALDAYANVMLLLPMDAKENEEIQIYVLTPDDVSYGMEQEFTNACNKAQAKLNVALSINVFSKQDWHGSMSSSPLYDRVSKEGIVL